MCWTFEERRCRARMGIENIMPVHEYSSNNYERREGELVGVKK